jgi:hypothetical protein
MHPDQFFTELTQQRLQEQIRTAQECHAAQRRMLRQFGQICNWVGKRFIVWSDQLQFQQNTLEPLNRSK